MKITLSLVLDLFFFCFFSFCISFIWFRYFLENTFFIIFLSLIVSSFTGILILLLKYRKIKKINLNKVEKNELQQLKKQLFTSDRKEVNLLFKNIFNLRKNSINLKETLNSFYLTQSAQNFYGNNGVIFTYYLDGLLLTDSNLKNILNNIILESKKQNYNIDSVYILCNSTHENAINFSYFYSFKIKFITIENFYSQIVKGLNLYPYKMEEKIKHKQKFKIFMSNFFSKKQFKTFIWCGLSIFIASLVVRYNIYYIITSSILFILAIICKARTEINVKNK